MKKYIGCAIFGWAVLAIYLIGLQPSDVPVPESPIIEPIPDDHMPRSTSFVSMEVADVEYMAMAAEIEEEKKEEEPQTEKEWIIFWTKEIGDMYGVPAELIQAMIEVESNYIPTANGNGCLGLMQINPYWHQERMERLNVPDLFDPYGNIMVGVDFLANLRDRYDTGDDYTFPLMAYNQGEHGALGMYENGQVSYYALKVLRRADELKGEE